MKQYTYDTEEKNRLTFISKWLQSHNAVSFCLKKNCHLIIKETIPKSFVFWVWYRHFKAQILAGPASSGLNLTSYFSSLWLKLLLNSSPCKGLLCTTMLSSLLTCSLPFLFQPSSSIQELLSSPFLLQIFSYSTKHCPFLRAPGVPCNTALLLDEPISFPLLQGELFARVDESSCSSLHVTPPPASVTGPCVEQGLTECSLNELLSNVQIFDFYFINKLYFILCLQFS